MKRWKPNKRKDRKTFSRTASRVHRRNIPGRAMRGGIRL